jgi:hypothetical protein
MFVEPLRDVGKILAQLWAAACEGDLHHWPEIASQPVKFLDRQLFLDLGVQLAPVEAVIARRIAAVGDEHQHIDRHFWPRRQEPLEPGSSRDGLIHFR